MQNTYLALLSEFNLIFEKCTMTGDAHEQLHEYLIPINNQLVGLKNCESGCTEEVEYLNGYLGTYFNYFE